jgi:hypothetical protein
MVSDAVCSSGKFAVPEPGTTWKLKTILNLNLIYWPKYVIKEGSNFQTTSFYLGCLDVQMAMAVSMPWYDHNRTE